MEKGLCVSYTLTTIDTPPPSQLRKFAPKPNTSPPVRLRLGPWKKSQLSGRPAVSLQALRPRDIAGSRNIEQCRTHESHTEDEWCGSL